MRQRPESPAPDADRARRHTHWHEHGPRNGSQGASQKGSHEGSQSGPHDAHAHHDHDHADGFAGGHSHPHQHVEVSLGEFLLWLYGEADAPGNAAEAQPEGPERSPGDK